MSTNSELAWKWYRDVWVPGGEATVTALMADDVIAEGDKVAVRWHFTATHAGPGAGLEPTGRRVASRGMTWLEFRDGKIVRGWDSWNLGGLMQQLAP